MHEDVQLLQSEKQWLCGFGRQPGKIQEGTEVLAQWGDFGGKIKNVRATITRYPYINLVDNKDYDLTTVPSGMDR